MSSLSASSSSKNNHSHHNNNPPVMKQQPQPQQQGRRSARRSRGQGHDPVIAPGFGTKTDIEKLSHDLSVGSDATLPSAAVEAMMNSRGRGILSPGAKDPSANKGTTSSAWANFMAEEGVDLYGSAAGTGTGTANDADQSNTTTAANNNDDDNNGNINIKKRAATKKKSGKHKSYNLQILEDVFSGEPATKKAKKGDNNTGAGVLLQSGTLDVTVVGRKGLSKENPSYQIQTPTRILPGVGITKVFTHCSACHSIALDTSGQVYGWGRNDLGQLTKDMPANVAVPTLLEGLSDYTIVSAAVGKGHTLLLTNEGQVLAVGNNKEGQCGIKSSTESVNQFKLCVFPPNVKIAQVACGEQFSVALSDEGQIYTTGLSQYGQLGNGETGEYFVTASKLAFANCNVFTLRNKFMERDPSQEFSSSSTNDKLVSITEDIRFQSIACGKHHTLAVEANFNDDDGDDNDSGRVRIFSWGCGNYGVLGHGVQSDEYFPREIAAFTGGQIWIPPGPLSASAGTTCSLLKTANGQVYYWGKHKTGGEAEMRPRLVEALANNLHVATHCAAGGQTVVCCTQGAQTVAWGQGPHGELGLGTAKSSAAPKFVESLTGCRIQDLACGYGHTLYVVRDEDAEDKAAIKKLAILKDTAKDELEAVWSEMPVSGGAKGKKKRQSRT